MSDDQGLPSLKLHEPVIVAQAPPAVRRWGPWQFPSLQRLPDGRLSLAFHVEADSAVAYGLPRQVMLSADDGQSWEPAPRDEAEILSSPWVQLPSGDLLRQVQRRSVAPEDVRDRLPPDLGQTTGGYGNPLTVFDASRFSADLAGYRFARKAAGAHAWVEEQAEVRIPGAIRAIYMGVLTFPWITRITAAPDGSLWGIDYGKRLVHGRVQDKLAARFLRSTDGGLVWEWLGELAYQPDVDSDPLADDRDGFTEPNLAFLGDGSVLCLVRTTDGHGVGPLYASRSDDGGRSWSTPRLFDDLGVWPALVTLPGGAVLAAYGRPGLFVRATLDPRGETWGQRLVVVPPRDLQTDTCSYADLLALGDEAALLAYSDFNVPDAQGHPCKSIVVRRISCRAAPS